MMGILSTIAQYPRNAKKCTTEAGPIEAYGEESRCLVCCFSICYSFIG